MMKRVLVTATTILATVLLVMIFVIAKNKRNFLLLLKLLVTAGKGYNFEYYIIWKFKVYLHYSLSK